MTLARPFIALTVLLALLTMHVFVVLAAGYRASIHHSGMEPHDMGTIHHMGDCPFMVHGTTLCSMTVLDHLTAFRSLSETTLPIIITLILIVETQAFWQLIAPRLKPFLFLKAHTFLRQRAHILRQFVYRQFQELFACGILHQKLYN